MYRLTEKHKAGRKFGRLFELPLGDYYDPVISILSLKVCIDVIKFDERMHQEWGDYEDKGQSLSDCIREHYGDEAAILFGELL